MADSHFRALLVGDNVTTGEVHWGAVAAGVIVALVGQMLLTLLGAGLGASYDATQGEALRGDSIAWGAYAWWAVTGTASAFAGGWTAGWVAGSSLSVDRIEGSFQGFLAWGAAALIVSLLVFGLASGSALAARLGGPLSFDAGQAAAGASQAALWSFLALIVGAGLAMLGGYLGVGHAKRVMASSPNTKPEAHAGAIAQMPRVGR